MNIKAVIFDLDGTLIDSTEEIMFICNEVLISHSLPIHNKKFYKNNIGQGIEHLLKKCIPNDNKIDFKMMLKGVKETYSKHLNTKTIVFDGVFELLDKLTKNKINIGIITNKMHTLAIRSVDLFFGNYNIKVIGSEHLFKRKPAPDSALHLANIFECRPSEVLFVGDSNIDIKTAKEAGMISAGVLWGNGTQSELDIAGADIIFEKVESLSIFIEKNIHF